MKRRYHDWSDRELEVSRLGSGARVIKTSDGAPQNEDGITFHDPFERRKLTGTVRLATGYFDSQADGIMYQITVDVD
ncbi:hypothetical protein [Rubrobacter indicoceani]|uniref:hypothetical protein n=1 Tax=Rubrobacter indicoceani TaxID=2051957 RepID=UPI000E5C2D0E|nr:hypothetical protein [Rubrobacter indicoceani]